eukprot:IDg7170t1
MFPSHRRLHSPRQKCGCHEPLPSTSLASAWQLKLIADVAIAVVHICDAFGLPTSELVIRPLRFFFMGQIIMMTRHEEYRNLISLCIAMEMSTKSRSISSRCDCTLGSIAPNYLLLKSELLELKLVASGIWKDRQPAHQAPRHHIVSAKLSYAIRPVGFVALQL